MIAQLVAISAFVFQGGDVADFVAAYAGKVVDPVVAAAAGPIPPIRIEMPQWPNRDGFDYLARYVAGRADADYIGMTLGAGPDRYRCQVFRPTSLPMWFAPGWSDAGFQQYAQLFPANQGALKRTGAGVVCASTPGSYSTVDGLTREAFAKTLTAHWLLANYRYAAAGTFRSETDFLRAVSAAVGGKFADGRESYAIDLDPAAYRTQLVAYWRDCRNATTSLFSVAYCDFRIAAIKALSDRQIAEAMKTPASFVNVEMPRDSEVGHAALAVVKAFVEELDAATGKPVASRQQHAALVDPTRPVKVYLSAPRGIKLRFYANTKEGGAVEF